MLTTINNFLHLFASCVWIGGMFFMHFILKPSAKQINPAEAAKIQNLIAPKFTIAAWSSMIILIITGIIKTPSTMLFDFSFIELTLKHILIIAAIVVGLIIAFIVVPKLKAAAPAPGQKPSDDFFAAQKSLNLLANINTFLGILILILASMLW
jgi:uncharacterized membrane protein